jgi:CheY-like chemotaxis protein
MLEELGYPYHCVATARDALAQINRDGSIQVLVADMQMSSMDGFVLIEEARARLGDHKPLSVVMLSNEVTADLAVKGLHVGAVDLLAKPLSFDAFSTAMRRAMRHLSSRRNGVDSTTFNAQLARLVSALDQAGERERNPQNAPAEAEISATLRAIIASRSMRNRFFEGRLFADPAWDILLDLTRAKFEGQQVSVSSVCIAASVPMSTALRWVRQMTDAGLLHRWIDPNDCRRALIALTDATAQHMRNYLTSVHALIQKI